MVGKKLINDPERVPLEAVEGVVAMNAPRLRQLPGMSVVVRRGSPVRGRVGVVVGGGSGHEPAFTEFVGLGMADAAVAGAVFTSPGPDLIVEAVKAVDGGAGVLFVHGNYAGDNMNFGMAAALLAGAGIATETVRVWDDIASAPVAFLEDRRGTAGDLLVIKIAGAAAERGWSLADTFRVASKARDRCRSLGVALSSCSLPGAKRPVFEIGESEMMVGMGLHGEQGLETVALGTADDATDVMVGRVLDDLPFVAGDEVVLLVNGYGSTTRGELHIVARRAASLLTERGVVLREGIVGNYCTSMEMAGCSVTLMQMDAELMDLWTDEASSPGFATARGAPR
jgi:phosphoenolpyruvate---glycerone phosphotransferase subunit DhaK